MNVLKPEKVTTIVVLLRNGISQREISRKAGIHRRTVRKYARRYNLEEEEPGDSKCPTLATGPDEGCGQNAPPRPPALPAGVSSKAIPQHARSACEPYREWIEEQVRLGRNAVSIYQADLYQVSQPGLELVSAIIGLNGELAVSPVNQFEKANGAGTAECHECFQSSFHGPAGKNNIINKKNC